MNQEQFLWYEHAKAVGYDMYEEPFERLCIETLLVYTAELKEHGAEAQHWFAHPFEGGLSLQMVCDVLGFTIGEVQRRARRMMEAQDRTA